MPMKSVGTRRRIDASAVLRKFRVGALFLPRYDLYRIGVTPQTIAGSNKMIGSAK